MILAAYIGRSPVSRLIQWQTRAGFDGPSHVAIDCEDGRIFEAWHTSGDGLQSGVRVIRNYGEGHTPGTVVRRYIWPMTDSQQAAAIRFLDEQVGKPYDLLGCLRFVTKRNRDVADKWFCSELAVAAGLAARAPLLNCEPYKVSPAMCVWSPVLTRIAPVITTKDGQYDLPMWRTA